MTPGRKLGPYEILEPIGAGGMGDVYKASDTRLNRLVAIKFSKEQFTERFEREARAVAALNHPHVCQIYDVGPNYLVMEMIDGRPLAGPLPLDLALQYGAQICDALDAAHRKGIAHRDLKPANILVTKHGIKLLDFGLAKTAAAPLKPGSAADDTVTNPLTGKHEIVGTLQYMSPEQLHNLGEQIDVRTDIFSFGLLLYEMLTGKRAFAGPTPASVIAAIIERPAPSLIAVAPPALDRVVQRCLAKNPDDRWQSARDVRVQLQWIAAAPAEAAVAQPVLPARRYWAVLIAALVIAAVSGLCAARWLRHSAAAVPRLKMTLEPQANESWYYPALSPDGTKIAFMATDGLRVRALDSLEAQVIKYASPLTAYYPLAWSPDGRSLVYYDLNTGELRKDSAAGGAPQTLVAGLQNFRGAAWNTDGTILFSAGGPMMRVSENGGVPVPVTAEQALYPTLLPDGNHFLFLGGRDRKVEEAIYAGSLNSKDLRKITVANSKAELTATGHLLFMRGVTLMAQAFDATGLRTTGEAFPVASDVGIVAVSRIALFSTALNGLTVYQTGGVGRSALTWLDRSGKPNGVIDNVHLHYDIELSSNGKALAATRVDPKSMLVGLWVTDLVRGTASRLTAEAEGVDFPAWSPDGKRIAYISKNRLYVTDSNGAGQREEVASNGYMPHWSPDGKTLVFVEGALRVAGKISLLPVGGNHKPETYLEGRFTQPAFSPDGRWMAYVSADSGGYEVFVQPVPTGNGKWQISTHGGAQPVWRQDGKELFYKSADGKIVAVPVTLGASFQAGVPKELFPVSTFGLFYVRRDYSVSPDGQRFLVNQMVVDRPQTVLLQNWLTPVPR